MYLMDNKFIKPFTKCYSDVWYPIFILHHYFNYELDYRCFLLWTVATLIMLLAWDLQGHWRSKHLFLALQQCTKYHLQTGLKGFLFQNAQDVWWMLLQQHNMKTVTHICSCTDVSVQLRPEPAAFGTNQYPSERGVWCSLGGKYGMVRSIFLAHKMIISRWH